LLLASLVLAPAAGAWSWPASGPVLRPFGVGDDPYAGGQHRGVDIGGKEGEPVLAPRAGVVVFAGSIPRSGRSVTIHTDDGYSVTLVHLGSLGVSRNAPVGEGDRIGTLGSSGDAEWDQPYLHLGVRLTSDPNGYVDPLRFLPPRSVAGGAVAVAPAPVPSDPEPQVPAAPPRPSPVSTAVTETPPPSPVPAPAPAVAPAAAEPPSETVPAPAPPSMADSPTAGDAPALTISAAKRTRVSSEPTQVGQRVLSPPARTVRRHSVVAEPETAAPDVASPPPVGREAGEPTPATSCHRGGAGYRGLAGA
jgi:hypothetical protein